MLHFNKLFFSGLTSGSVMNSGSYHLLLYNYIYCNWLTINEVQLFNVIICNGIDRVGGVT